VPVRYDAAHRSKIVIDVPAMQKRALHDYIQREQQPKQQKPARAGAETSPPWVVRTDPGDLRVATLAQLDSRTSLSCREASVRSRLSRYVGDR
jgi:hypothetical protein